MADHFGSDVVFDDNNMLTRMLRRMLSAILVNFENKYFQFVQHYVLQTDFD